MSYILGLAIGHNSSGTLMKDGEIIFHIEEERLSRTKRDGNPFKILLMLQHFTNRIDKLVLTATTPLHQVVWNGGDYYSELLKKLNETIDLTDKHHLMHAANSFYNSGFDDAITVVIDGAGSAIQDNNGNIMYEAETIFRTNYKDGFIVQYQNMITNEEIFNIKENFRLHREPTIVKMYEGVTQFLGWHPIEAGKTMGLAAYGKVDPRIDDLFNADDRGRKDIFEPNYPASSIIRQDSGYYHFQNEKEFRANLARKVQFNSEWLAEKLIRKAIKIIFVLVEDMV